MGVEGVPAGRNGDPCLEETRLVAPEAGLLVPLLLDVLSRGRRRS